MESKESFIGMGKNPNPGAPDIPVGFGLELMNNAPARSNYDSLSNPDKSRLIAYIQGGTTGDEAVRRINYSIERLNQGDFTFFR